MQEKLSEVTLILIGSTVIILLLTGLIVFSLIVNQKRKYRHRQEKLSLKNDYDQELLRSTVEIQTQAFESISRELHDNVGTLISIAMVHIKSMDASTREKEKQRLSESENLLNEALESLRDISRSIHPENISRLGWQQSLESELQRIGKSKMFTVAYTQEGEPFAVELGKQVIIFRILQESLNNIVRHSNGLHIGCHVSFFGGEVNITITDDGKGFDQPGEMDYRNGSGLRNMRARAAMLPAVLSIGNGPKKGTVVKLTYREASNQL